MQLIRFRRHSRLFANAACLAYVVMIFQTSLFSMLHNFAEYVTDAIQTVTAVTTKYKRSYTVQN